MAGAECVGLATSSDTARSVQDTTGRFWLHRVSSACLWLEQRFFLEMPKLAPLLCSRMLKPNLSVVFLLSQSVLIFEPPACVLQPGLHGFLDTFFSF